MSNHNNIIVIHADDSDQHSGHLKQILDGLKSENRIKSYTTHNSSVITENTFNSLVDDDMVILLLTAGLEDIKSPIEGYLLNVKKSLPGAKIVEIIIDHIPYEPEFIAFPSDLQPIRSREDMDATWKQIGDSLRSIYPVVTPLAGKTKSNKWKRFIPFLIGILVVVGLFFGLRGFMTGADQGVHPIIEEFEITELTASVEEPASFRGDCPHEFRFEAKITSNGPGKTSYSWLKSDGSASEEQILEFTEAGTESVQAVWQVGSNGQGNNNYWQQLEIKEPVEKLSNKANITVDCIAPIAENCLDFNNTTHAIEEFTIAGRGTVYSVSYESQSLIGFRDRDKMLLAKDIVEHYGFNKLCYTRRINSGLRYFKANTTFPTGGFPGEDCMRIIDPSNITLARNPTNSKYSVRDGGSGQFLFTNITKNEANKIVEVINHYKPKYKCTLGTPREGMLYMRY